MRFHEFLFPLSAFNLGRTARVEGLLRFFGCSLSRQPIRLHPTPTHDNGSKGDVPGTSHSQNSHHTRFYGTCLVRAVSASLTPDLQVYQGFPARAKASTLPNQGELLFVSKDLRVLQTLIRWRRIVPQCTVGLCATVMTLSFSLL